MVVCETYNQVGFQQPPIKKWKIINVSGLLVKNDVNVISVDYAMIAFGYTTAYRTIASQVSSFLRRNGISPGNTIVMGQSLGAQVAGVLYQYGFKPSSIIGGKKNNEKNPSINALLFRNGPSRTAI